MVEIVAAVVVVGLIVVVAGLVVRGGTRVTGFIQLERLHPPTPQVHRHIWAMEGLPLQKATILLQLAIS